jgi:hypothetical protein
MSIIYNSGFSLVSATLNTSLTSNRISSMVSLALSDCLTYDNLTEINL